MPRTYKKSNKNIKTPRKNTNKSRKKKKNRIVFDASKIHPASLTF